MTHLLMALAAALAVPAPRVVPVDPKEAIESQVAYYQQLSQVENISLVAVLSDTWVQDAQVNRRLGLNGLRIIAASANLQLVEAGGSYLLVPPDLATEVGVRQEMDGALAWVVGLDQDRFEALLLGELKLTELPPAVQERAMGAVASIARDPEVALSRWPEARLRLDPVLTIREVRSDGSYGRRRTLFSGIEPPAPSSDTRWAGLDSVAPVPMEPRRTGPLDFGSGEALTVGAFRDKGVATFNARYYVERRFLDDLIFVSGGFDEDGFDEVLRALTFVDPAEEVPRVAPVGAASLSPALLAVLDQADRDWRLSEGASASFGEIAPSLFSEPRQSSFDSFRSQYPGLASSFESAMGSAVDPNLRLEVRLSLRLVVDAGSIFRGMRGSQRMFLGIEYPIAQN